MWRKTKIAIKCICFDMELLDDRINAAVPREVRGETKGHINLGA